MSGGLVGGLTYLGGGLGLFGLSRILAQLLPFIAGRLDARARRLDDQQARLDARYDARLQHLEAAEFDQRKRIVALEAELGETRDLLGEVAAELRSIDPANEKLADVARHLRRATPLEPKTPEDLIEKLKGLK